MRNQIVGKLGEEKALEYLSSLSYELVTQNYKVKAGEIDLIVKNASEIMFVEVKTRTSNTFGKAIQSFPKKRIERLFFAGQIFISENPQYENLNQQYVLIAIDDGEIELIPIDVVI